MKVVKKLLLVIALLIVLVLVIALFVNKEYVVVRDININKPNQEVFDYVKLLKNQDNFNKWTMADPNMKKDFQGTDGTIGFIYAWNGNKEVGEGDQRIIEINNGENIKLALHFIRPFEGLAVTEMSTTALSSNLTKVTWGMQGRSPYPMNFMNLFINKILGGDLDTSLQRLKSILESN